MTLDPASLEQAIRASDGDAVRELLRGATEAWGASPAAAGEPRRIPKAWRA